MTFRTCLAAIALATASLAAAADPAYDTTYGSGGYARIDLGGSEAARGLALDNAGRSVIAGFRRVAGTYAVAPFLARYTAAGALDAGFGDGGTAGPGVQPDVGDSLISVAIDGDRLYLATMAGDGFQVFGYDAAGHPLADFGTAGRAHVVLGAALAPVLALQSGRLVVAGGVTGSAPDANRMIVARLTAAGQLDGSFAGGGVSAMHFGSANDELERYTAVVVAPDASLYLAGQIFDSTWYSFTRHLDANGQPVPAYGWQGTALQAVAALTYTTALVLESGARPVVATSRCAWNADGSKSCRPVLYRLHADGTPDASFGAAASALGGDGLSAHLRALALDRYGRLVAVGELRGATTPAAGFVLRADGDNLAAAVERQLYGASGADAEYGNGAVRIDRYGRAVVAGTAAASHGISDVVTARFLP